MQNKIKLNNIEVEIKFPVLIVYHTDADGVCSAIITYEAIKRLTGIAPKAIPCMPGSVEVVPKLKKEIEEKSPHTLIFVDMAVDQDFEKLEKLKSRNIIVIDHHIVTEDLNKKGMIHINPKLEGNEKYYPCSKLCFDIFEKIVKIDDLEWVSAVGTIADSGFSDWKSFIHKVNKKYNYLSYADYVIGFDAPLGEIGKWINAGRLVYQRKGLQTAFNAILESKSPDDFLNCKNEHCEKLKEWNESIQEKIKKLVDKFDEEKPYKNDLYFYKITGGKNVEALKSTVATIISNKFKDRTIFVLTEPEGEFAFFSARRSDGKVNIQEIIKKAEKKFDKLKGGGHIQACAGSLKKNDVELFKEFVSELI